MRKYVSFGFPKPYLILHVHAMAVFSRNLVFFPGLKMCSYTRTDTSATLAQLAIQSNLNTAVKKIASLAFSSSAIQFVLFAGRKIN